MRRLALAVLCAASFPVTAMAHPGHSVQVGHPETISHYALHPEHWGILAVLAAAAAIAMAVRSTKRLQAAVQVVRRRDR